MSSPDRNSFQLFLMLKKQRKWSLCPARNSLSGLLTKKLGYDTINKELRSRKEEKMDKSSARERIEYLRREITENSKLYYEKDAPKISDYEYDMMFCELTKLETEYPEFKTPDSPTVRVGGKALDKFEKFTHNVKMGSLTDVFSFDELIVFCKLYIILAV